LTIQTDSANGPEDLTFEGQTVMLAPATGFYFNQRRGLDEVSDQLCFEGRRPEDGP